MKTQPILDPGTDSHLVALGAPVHNEKVTDHPPSVTLPDGNQVH